MPQRQINISNIHSTAMSVEHKYFAQVKIKYDPIPKVTATTARDLQVNLDNMYNTKSIIRRIITDFSVIC